jgi:hypothetical protein
MSGVNLVTCTCGATLQIPPQAQGKKLRCPQCSRTVAAPPATTPPSPAPSLNAIVAGPSDVGLTCSICLSAICTGDALHRCVACDQLYHNECWSEVGGCGTFGCKEAPAVDKSADSPQAPLTAWGDEKNCPICGETIKSIALKCRYCGATFETADPQSVGDLRRSASQKAELASVQQSVIALFVVALLGLCAPLIVIVSLIYLIPRRAQVAKCGPVYMIMGWTALGLSCCYCLLFFLLIALSQ